MVEQTDRLGSGRIGKLLFEFSMPAIIGMLVNAIYNIVDRIYVGQGVNPLGIAGITIVMPAMLALQAASMLIGVGANSLFSIRLGEGRRDQVEKIMGHAFALLFLVPGVVIAFLFIFMDDVIRLLGASEAVFPFAKTYLRIILYGGFFSAMGPGINHFIRSDGHPRTSMLTQIIGALLNIILDPIFIFGFGWGIAGAAWATIISQFVSFVWVIYYFNSKYTALRFRLTEMRLGLKLTVDIIAIGFAPFAMQLAMSLVNILLNQRLSAYGGDAAVAAMGIVYSILIVIFMPLQGLNQGAQPIMGYNFGAKKFSRVRKTYKWAVVSGTIFASAGFIIAELFPAFFIGIFSKDTGELLNLGVRCLRISVLLFPAIGFQIITANYFQAVGKPGQGTLLSLSRQILFYIPLLFLFPAFWGINGVFFAMPIADMLSTLLSALVMSVELKRLNDLVRRERP
ncbi:MAG: MATE family efflux transporter [Treponema sp.]|jgi:putative MATE family efflux protein|nr:MATE family efflux transporter [Treponema sp.]